MTQLLYSSIIQHLDRWWYIAKYWPLLREEMARVTDRLCDLLVWGLYVTLAFLIQLWQEIPLTSKSFKEIVSMHVVDAHACQIYSTRSNGAGLTLVYILVASIMSMMSWMRCKNVRSVDIYLVLYRLYTGWFFDIYTGSRNPYFLANLFLMGYDTKLLQTVSERISLMFYMN